MSEKLMSGLPLKEAYNDLARPALTEVGKLISLPISAVNALLAPCYEWVQTRNTRIVEINTAIAKKVADIPPEKLCKPDAYVVVPALQAITYCMENDELKELYANLLAKAINSDFKSNVHPAFIEIIKQLSPSEARLLKIIADDGFRIPIVNLKLFKRGWLSTRVTYQTLAKNVIFGDAEAEYDDEQIAIDNLTRLGLIDITFLSKIINNKIYEDLINNFSDFEESARKNYAKRIKKGEILEWERGILESRALGKSFCSICL